MRVPARSRMTQSIPTRKPGSLAGAGLSGNNGSYFEEDT